jgi:MFS family permease
MTTDTKAKTAQAPEGMVIGLACIGMFLSTLDSGIVNVALPSLQRVFHASVTSIAWSVTLYMMALSSTIVALGRLSDRLGKIKIAAAGLAVFAAGSVFCGAANSVAGLTLSRAVQGLGAAMLQATAVAMITGLVAEERRNAALGTLGTILGMGPVLGPALGGLLLSLGSWRWMFWINIPICAAGLWLAGRLRAVREETRPSPIDAAGNVLFAAAVLALLQGLAKLPQGWTAAWGPLLAAAALGTWFAWRELRVKVPMVAPELLRDLRFSIPFWSTAALGYATTVAFIVPPYFLQRIDHLVPWRIGLVALCSPLGIMALSRISAGMIPKTGMGRLMAVGAGIMVCPLAVLGLQGSGWRPWQIGALLLAYGAGYGIALPSILASVMWIAPREEQGTIGAAHRMNQNLGIGIGAGVTAAIIQAHARDGIPSLMAGFRLCWLTAAAVILLFAALFAIWARKAGSLAEPQEG